METRRNLNSSNAFRKGHSGSESVYPKKSCSLPVGVFASAPSPALGIAGWVGGATSSPFHVVVVLLISAAWLQKMAALL